MFPCRKQYSLFMGCVVHIYYNATKETDKNQTNKKDKEKENWYKRI